jgi:hypothetical protein
LIPKTFGIKQISLFRVDHSVIPKNKAWYLKMQVHNKKARIGVFERITRGGNRYLSTVPTMRPYPGLNFPSPVRLEPDRFSNK